MRPIEIDPEVREILNSPDGLRKLLAAIFQADAGEAQLEINGRKYIVEPSFRKKRLNPSNPDTPSLS